MSIYHLFIEHLYKYSILHVYIDNTLSIPETITMTLNVGMTLVLEAIIMALNEGMLFVIITHYLYLQPALVRASIKKKPAAFLQKEFSYPNPRK